MSKEQEMDAIYYIHGLIGYKQCLFRTLLIHIAMEMGCLFMGYTLTYHAPFQYSQYLIQVWEFNWFPKKSLKAYLSLYKHTSSVKTNCRLKLKSSLRRIISYQFALVTILSSKLVIKALPIAQFIQISRLI